MTYLEQLKRAELNINLGLALLAIYSAPFIAVGWVAGMTVRIIAISYQSIIIGYQKGR